MELFERVELVMKARGWTAYAWAQRADLSEATITNLVARKARGARVTTLTAMATSAGVPFDWLARGEGPSGLDVVPPNASPQTTPELERAPIEGSPLERSLGHAFDPKRHLPRDLRAVQDVLGETFQLQDPELDLVEKARVWLDAAAALRRAGVAVTAGTLLDRVTVGKTSRAAEVLAEREAAVNAEAQAMVDADDELIPIKPEDLPAEQALLRKGAGLSPTAPRGRRDE